MNLQTGIAIASAVLAILGALLVVRRITRPLRSLVDATRRIAAGDYSARLPTREAGEVGRLAREVDAMQHEVEEREAAILHLAFHDDLTDLPNRNQFRIDLSDQTEEARRHQRRLAVAMVDFDRVKSINDMLGHHVGDRLLAAIASQLQAAADQLEVKVARLGGDEFGILLPVGSVTEATEQVERLRGMLGGVIEIDDLRVDIEANVGIALFPDQGGDAETLLQQAEVAMYVAKERHLGVTFYDPSYDRHSIQRLGLMGDLRRALDHNDLELRFQPKLHLDTGTVDQAEVLLRWTHPKLGKISPGEFIPIAEQTGFIRDITAWVLRRALEQVGRWLQEGLEVSVAINISAYDLHDSTLPARLRQLLETTGVESDHLVLEITEGTVMSDLETGQRVLDELDRIGATLSIDDFGTGYSSLAQLQKLPVQELKIDRSFISQMMTSPEMAQIVRSTIELGHNLGLKVVAEGVESKETLEALRQMGCDLAQGHFVSRPLSAQELEKWRSSMRSVRARG